MAFDIKQHRRRIIMDVPHIEVASGDVPFFMTDMVAPIKECLLNIIPQNISKGNDGSGATGVTGVNVHISPSTSQIGGKTYTISWEAEAGLVYGCTYDVITGELNVTMAIMDLGTLNWIYRKEMANTGIFSAAVPFKTNKSNFYCDRYVAVDNTVLINAMPNKAIKGYPSSVSDILYIRDTAFSDASSFNAAISGTQLIYEMDAPIKIQLAPQKMYSLRGANHVWMNADGAVDVRYWTH